MGGIIGAALAAAGDAGVQSINQEIQRQDVSDRDQAMAKLQTQKELTVLAAQKQARIDEANQLREQQSSRINSAIPAVAQDRLGQQYAMSDQAVAAADAGQTAAPLTQEQRDVIAQAKKVDLSALANDPQSYVQAAMRSGDLDPHTIASLVQQENAFRRQESSQQAQFEHSDQSQKAQFEHSDAAQRASQAFQASENNKQRAMYEAGRTLDPSVIESNAQAIAEGRMPPLTGNALRSAGGAQTMARALQINPTYSAKDYATASKAEKDFATGKQGNAVRSFNVALSHLDTLDAAAKALKNGDTQMLNKIGNMIASQTGAPAPTNFDAVKHIVADEIVKAVTGSAGALGDREAAAHTLEKANSPEQLAGVIGQYKELMVGQLRGLSHQYSATTGLDNFESKYLSDQARAMIGNAHGANPAAPRPGATTVPNPMQPPGGRPSLNSIFGG